VAVDVADDNVAGLEMTDVVAKVHDEDGIQEAAVEVHEIGGSGGNVLQVGMRADEIDARSGSGSELEKMVHFDAEWLAEAAAERQVVSE
jgi:hypothetical protein